MKRVSLHMSKVLLCFAALFLFGNRAFAQAPYCGATYFQGCGLQGSINDFSVTGVASTAINDLSTGCIGGTGGLPGSYYDDKTSMSVSFSPGGTYTLTASSGSSSPFPIPFPCDLQVWIDFDGNNTFDIGEEIGGGPLTPTASAFTLTIPLTATPGTYRMRAVSSGTETYPSVDPCPVAAPLGNASTGETHDYTAVIVSACTAPVVTMGAATCSTQVVNWTAIPSVTGYEYVTNTTAASPTGAGTATTATTYTATALNPGTIYYAHVRTNCGGSFSSWTNVAFTTPGPGAIVGNPATCPGTPTQLSSTGTGGVWTSSNTSAATVSGTGLVTGVTSGTTWITYTLAGCSSTFSMTVGNMPPITGITNICPSGTSTLANPIPGGTWSSSNPTIASVGATSGLVTAGSGSGTTVITYSSSGCSATVTVTVSPLPAITGGTSVCVGNTITLANTATGGTWSSATPANATVGTTSGVVTGVAVGTTVIRYTLGSCSVTTTITVGAAIAPITGTTTFCVTGGTTLASTTAGGAWSSSSNAIATVNSTGAVTGVTAGSATISYTVGGCSATADITVDPNSVIITGVDTVCKGAGHEVNLSSNSPGGTWSSSNTSRATVDPVTGVVTGVTSGQAFVITYTVTNTCGTLTDTNAMYVRTAAKCATGFEAVENVAGDLKVFPNPNNGTFTINFTSDLNEDVQVTVTNIVGAKVKEFTMATNIKTDLQLAVPSGIYLISASSAHGTHVKKIVIER